MEKLVLAAFLHDIGKFAQRAEATLRKDTKFYNYTHAAFSADVLEKYRDIFGLSDEEIDFSAMHHNLKENMDDEYWIIAAADRLASGFEREVFKDYNETSKEFESFKEQRLKSIFDENKEYKIDKLSPKNIFSTDEKGGYKELWKEFLEDLRKIKDKRAIDYLYRKYTTFIPSSTSFKLKNYKPVKANIPLYDHSKTTAIFASVIANLVENGNKSVIDYYKYGKKEDYEKNNFLLVAGDFFGIQNFIFDKVKAKYASKMLRAKSAYVEILTRIAAYYIVKKIQISDFAIISMSAGKFEILLPNLDKVKKILEGIKKEFDEFFYKEFFATTGIGLFWVECGIKDFIRVEENNEIPYKKLRKKIADGIELMKLNKFESIEKFMFEYDKDINNANLCEFCEIRKGKKEYEYTICKVCQDYVEIGKNLVSKEFLSISLGEKFSDFKISFDKKGDYVFDISKDEEFRGYEKWEISSYLATVDDLDEFEKEIIESEKILTFEDLAKLSVIDGIEDKRKRGVEAIGVFKGDVDFMGNFIQGLSKNAKKINVTASFSKFNFFSRLMNYFFSVYAPYLMKTKYNKIYTIFAGGDDIYVVGSWDEVSKFIKEFRNDFIRFCENQMKLSGGFVVTKPNKPINFISRVVEEAESEAKDYKKDEDYLKKQKNALCAFREVVSFDEYVQEEIDNLFDEYKGYLNTAFLYRLLEFANMSKSVDKNPLNAMWISKFEYSFRRNLEEVYQDVDFNELKSKLKTYIENSPSNFIIKLHEFIYKRRKNG
ncbi:MAG: type III-A CRISPR-associated protein Cas10/Csm1 [Nautiliaceae bacterium]